MDSYKTLCRQASAELTEKKSRFIAYCKPAATERQALDFIEQIRRERKSASHNVYAYLLRADNLCRYSDAGEPQGTAGLPVLDILKRGEIVDAVVVVTRYFGGVLLGTGGLVRAYSQAAALAVAASGIAVMGIRSVWRVGCEYALYDRMQKLAETAGAVIVDSIFEDAVILTLAVDAARSARLLEEISELTRGQAIPEHLEDRYEVIEKLKP